ncbi:MAG: hypothetical protein EA422_05250 [Gemmatimonadales bacterium]|nr:MAG: hypothetical protein EA422_05250 [Gemmatimonadales bacterium]
MTMNPSLVDRFFSVLVQEIRNRVPAYLESSFTVAEIYQTLVPYRTHRDRIGAEMNGDYEDALLRLLAGEGDYLALESDAARQRLRREADSSHPNTGLYREYAAVGVRLNARKASEVSMRRETSGAQGGREGSGVSDEELDALVGRALDSADEELRLDALLGQALGEGAVSPPARKHETPRAPARSAGKHKPAAGADATPSGGAQREFGSPSRSDSEPEPKVSAEPVQPSEVQSTVTAPSAPPVESPSVSAGDPVVRSRRVLRIPDGIKLGTPPRECPECQAELPDRDNLRFCPFCGANVFLLPCGACGEVLERGWNYCVACGTGVE